MQFIYPDIHLHDGNLKSVEYELYETDGSLKVLGGKSNGPRGWRESNGPRTSQPKLTNHVSVERARWKIVQKTRRQI